LPQEVAQPTYHALRQAKPRPPTPLPVVEEAQEQDLLLQDLESEMVRLEVLEEGASRLQPPQMKSPSRVAIVIYSSEIRPGVGGVIMDRPVLMLRDNEGFQGLPGGLVGDGEDPLRALHRAIHEQFPGRGGDMAATMWSDMHHFDSEVGSSLTRCYVRHVYTSARDFNSMAANSSACYVDLFGYDEYLLKKDISPEAGILMRDFIEYSSRNVIPIKSLAVDWTRGEEQMP